MFKLHKTAQYDLIENVEYHLYNTVKFISLLEQNGLILSHKAKTTLDLNLIKREALKGGFEPSEIEFMLNSCEKQLFQENLLGKRILKLARAFVKEPITPDGIIKDGFLNHLAANGLQKEGITGKFANGKKIKNLVTNTGLAGVASRINGSGGEAAFTYIAVGTGATAASTADTTLQTESSTSGLSRANSTATRVTTTVTNDTAQDVVTFTVTGTVAVTESGVLNAASVGTLLCRQVFSAINVVNGDSLQITWQIKAS